MSFEIHGLDLRLAKKMLFTGVNLRIHKPNLVVYVLDENGLAVVGADVNITSTGHNLDSVTDSEGTALSRFMPAINNTLTVNKEGYATSSQVIFNETPSTLSVYVQLYASEIRLKVVNNQNEPIEGATCRVLNAIGGSNNVLSFDGVDDYVDIPHNVNQLLTGGGTIEAIIYPKGAGGGNTGRILDKSASSSIASGFALMTFSNNNLFFRIGTSLNVFSSNNSLTLNQWQHVAATWTSAGSVKLYVNAVEVGSGTTNAASIITTANSMRIGNRSAATDRAYNGLISDVRLWNVVKSQSEIQESYLERLTGSESNFVFYSELSEGVGITVQDKVNNNNGTIYGATWQEVSDLPIVTGIAGYDPTPYDTQTTNANGLCILNYQINTIHGLEVTLPGKRRFIMPFQRTTRGLLDWQVMLSDYLATFATDRGNILINSEPENNDSNLLIE